MPDRFNVQILSSLDDFPASLHGGAVAIGNFDGVHLGHAQIIDRLICKARETSGPAIAFTFDPHPVRILRPEAAPPPLTWTDRKAELLARLGVDAMVAYPTDEALLALSAREFFASIVQQKLKAKAMAEGPNFYFGRDRQGDVNLLAELCSEAGINLQIVEPLLSGGEIVSSSRVRKLIAAGAAAEARALLTEPYRIRGMVMHGAGRGAKIGIPTANIAAIDTLLPGMGVYAGRAWIDGDARPAAINIGPNPTFGEETLKVEAHVIDYQGSLYGQPLEVDFLERLRDIQPFASVDALIHQLKKDVAAARNAATAFDAGESP